MQKHKVVLTRQAIYDIADIAEYIEAEFDVSRANQFQDDIQNQIKEIALVGGIQVPTNSWKAKNRQSNQQSIARQRGRMICSRREHKECCRRKKSRNE